LYTLQVVECFYICYSSCWSVCLYIRFGLSPTSFQKVYRHTVLLPCIGFTSWSIQPESRQTLQWFLDASATNQRGTNECTRSSLCCPGDGADRMQDYTCLCLTPMIYSDQSTGYILEIANRISQKYYMLSPKRFYCKAM